MGPGFCNFVKGVFQGNTSLAYANQTLISLIPKIDQPKRIDQFQPISLYSVHYKCITKIITQRLRGLMADLTSPFQSGFVPGRHIQDNIVIGQEILLQDEEHQREARIDDR